MNQAMTKAVCAQALSDLDTVRHAVSELLLGAEVSLHTPGCVGPLECLPVVVMSELDRVCDRLIYGKANGAEAAFEVAGQPLD